MPGRKSVHCFSRSFPPVMAGHSRPKDGVAFARLCPGHPRLPCCAAVKTWMPGTSPGMTECSRHLEQGCGVHHQGHQCRRLGHRQRTALAAADERSASRYGIELRLRRMRGACNTMQVACDSRRAAASSRSSVSATRHCRLAITRDPRCDEEHRAPRGYGFHRRPTATRPP
jgi:hypothetical protein